MIIARMIELDHVPLAGNYASGSFAQCANAAVSPAFRRQIMSQSIHFRCAHCETQLIVIAASQRQLAGAALSNRADQFFGHRQVAEHELDPTAARMSELPSLPQLAVCFVVVRFCFFLLSVSVCLAW